jgi:DNA invertase Pin-like site-specific DNA recombinase
MDDGEPVLLYARISEDDGTEQGVDRQLEDGRALAATRGWKVVAEFVDNDISALGGRRRPGYESLLDAVQAGTGRRIVVWQTSRLWRSRRERAEGIEMLRAAACPVTPVKGPELDMATAYGRGMAGLLGEFDTMESEVKGERVARAAKQRAQQGRANGVVGYGWRRVHQHDDRGVRSSSHDVIHEPAAAVVREITARVLRMETLAGITADLNARGVPAPGAALRFVDKARAKNNPSGTRWSRSSVKKLALRAANAGLRVHRRGEHDEAVYDAAWPALVSRADWEQVTAILSAPSRARTNPGGRRHLLTWGIGECGVCAAHLRVATVNRRHVLYTCEASGCVGRNQMRVDEFVAAVVVARLAQPDALAWLRSRDDEGAVAARASAEELRARVSAAADAYGAGRIGLDALERVEAQCRPGIEAAERRLAGSVRAVPAGVLADLAGPAAEAKWEAAPVSTRRAVLEALGMRLRVMPTRPGPGFDPDSLVVDWPGATSA